MSKINAFVDLTESPKENIDLKKSPFIGQKDSSNKEKLNKNEIKQENKNIQINENNNKNNNNNNNNNNSEDEEDLPKYKKYNKGDCVLMFTGKQMEDEMTDESCFLALINKVTKHNFVAQWYYRVDDLEDEEKKLFPSPHFLENEVFLSDHQDRNKWDVIYTKCEVYGEQEYNSIMKDLEIERENNNYNNLNIENDKDTNSKKQLNKILVCRYKYNPSNKKKPFIRLSSSDVRDGTKKNTGPRIGSFFQAIIPKYTKKENIKNNNNDNNSNDDTNKNNNNENSLSMAIWSTKDSLKYTNEIKNFLQMTHFIKFSVGFYATITLLKEKKSILCQILHQNQTNNIQNNDAIHSLNLKVKLSNGKVYDMDSKQLISRISDDIAYKCLYLSGFNIAAALYQYCKYVLDDQLTLEISFKQEELQSNRKKYLEKKKENNLKKNIKTNDGYGSGNNKKIKLKDTIVPASVTSDSTNNIYFNQENINIVKEISPDITKLTDQLKKTNYLSYFNT